MAKYYAVKVGRVPGIYNTWEDCKANVEGYSSPVYKSFTDVSQAAEFMGWAVHREKKDTEKPLNVQEVAGNTLTAYVDGSYNIATGEYGMGVVLIDDTGKVVDTLSEKGTDEELSSMRNVAGEIKASEAAMRYALEHKYSGIVIFHDYEGIAKWCQGLWKTNKEGTRDYKRFYDEVSKKLLIEFVKVKGHSGDNYNDMADDLAKKAAGIL